MYDAETALLQELRMAAERPSGEHNCLWTPDAAQEAVDHPQRAAFVE